MVEKTIRRRGCPSLLLEVDCLFLIKEVDLRGGSHYLESVSIFLKVFVLGFSYRSELSARISL